MSYLQSKKEETYISNTESADLFHKSIQTQVITSYNFLLESSEKGEKKILEHSKRNAIKKNYSLIFQLLKKIVDGK